MKVNDRIYLSSSLPWMVDYPLSPVFCSCGAVTDTVELPLVNYDKTSAISLFLSTVARISSMLSATVKLTTLHQQRLVDVCTGTLTLDPDTKFDDVLAFTGFLTSSMNNSVGTSMVDDADCSVCFIMDSVCECRSASMLHSVATGPCLLLRVDSLAQNQSHNSSVNLTDTKLLSCWLVSSSYSQQSLVYLLSLVVSLYQSICQHGCLVPVLSLPMAVGAEQLRRVTHWEFGSLSRCYDCISADVVKIPDKSLSHSLPSAEFTIVDSLLRFVVSTPDSIAIQWIISFDPNSIIYHLTYKQLWNAAVTMGHTLSGYCRLHSVGSSVDRCTVAVAVPTSFGGVMVNVCVWVMNAIVVPVEWSSSSSAARFIDMLRDSCACMLVCDDLDARAIEDCLVANGIVISCVRLSSLYVIDHNITEPLKSSHSTTTTPPLPRLLDCCHIAFTSGSTLVPRGVKCSHKNLATFCHGKNVMHGISKDSHILLLSSHTFDPSLGDVAATLSIGATLCVAHLDGVIGHLAAVISRLMVTHITTNPLIWTVATDGFSPVDVPSLQVVALGGEKMSETIITKWGNGPHRLLNTYGLTEAAVYQTVHECRSVLDRPCLGKPFPSVWMRVAPLPLPDSPLTVPPPCPVGVVGEILIGGPQVADYGYIGGQYLSMYPCMNSNDDIGKILRTKDFGMRCWDGMIRLIGRCDDQVKLSGRRVELGGIEVALCRQCGNEFFATSAVVCLLEKCSVAVAVVTLSPSLASSEPKSVVTVFDASRAWSISSVSMEVSVILRRHCESILPRHEIPGKFFALSNMNGLFDDVQWPKMPSGKVHRKAIAHIASMVYTQVNDLNCRPRYIAVIDDDELVHITALAWCIVLGLPIKLHHNRAVPCVSRQSSFAYLGGTSLTALRLVNKLKAVVTVDETETYCVGSKRSLMTGDDTHENDWGYTIGPLSASSIMATPRLGDFVDLLRRNGIRPIANAVNCLLGDLDTLKESSSIGMPSNSVTPLLASNALDSFPSDYRALLSCCEIGRIEAVKCLLHLGVAPNEGSPAVDTVDTRRVLFSLKHQHQQLSHANAKTRYLSPLHIAAARGDINIVILLLVFGAKITATNSALQMPAHIAAACVSDKDATVLELLLSKGSPLTTRDVTKQTLVHTSARVGHVSALIVILSALKKFLNDSVSDKLRSQASSIVTCVDRWYRSPLHWAVVNLHLECVRVLLAQDRVRNLLVSLGPIDPKRGFASIKKGRMRTTLPLETPLHICCRLFRMRYGCFSAVDYLCVLENRTVDVSHSDCWSDNSVGSILLLLIEKCKEWNILDSAMAIEDHYQRNPKKYLTDASLVVDQLLESSSDSESDN